MIFFLAGSGHSRPKINPNDLTSGFVFIKIGGEA